MDQDINTASRHEEEEYTDGITATTLLISRQNYHSAASGSNIKAGGDSTEVEEGEHKDPFENERYNIFVLGFSFLLIFTAYNTSANAQPSVLEGMGLGLELGLLCLSVINGVYAFASFIAPAAVSITGPRMGMFVGVLAYVSLIASCISPIRWVLLTTSALTGVGAAVLWTSQGVYITKCSQEHNRGRNMGIFWSMMHTSLLVGGLATFFIIPNDARKITPGIAFTLYTTLTCICIAGLLCLLLLKKAPTQYFETKVTEEKNVGELEGCIRSVDSSRLEEDSGGSNLNRSLSGASMQTKRLLDVEKCTKEGDTIRGSFDNIFIVTKNQRFLLLVGVIIYTGVVTAFANGIYSTIIGGDYKGMKNLPKDFKPQMIGLAIAASGLGEMIGGMSLGKLGDILGRTAVLTFGCILHCLTFSLMYINLVSGWMVPSIYLALACATILGIGDAAFNTQLYALLGTFFNDKYSSAAFALFKLLQSGGTALAYYFFGMIPVAFQLLVCSIACLLGFSLCIIAIKVHIINSSNHS
eukprot:Nk52_evm6s243 gene=Nk52_evmTU6s243